MLSLALAGCGEVAQLPLRDGMGPDPALPAPAKTAIPTVKVASAKGWSAGEKPTPAAGLAVSAFADKLQHPRWIYVLPNGDVLVAETDAPERPEEGKSLKGKAMASS